MTEAAAGVTAPNAPNDGESRLRMVGATAIALDWGATTEVIPWSEVISVHSVRNHCEIVTHG